MWKATSCVRHSKDRANSPRSRISASKLVSDTVSLHQDSQIAFRSYCKSHKFIAGTDADAPAAPGIPSISAMSCRLAQSLLLMC
jgi:hypothetical protein